MSVWYYIAGVLNPLLQIIGACIPVFVVLVLLEKLLDKVSDATIMLDITGWFDRKLKQAKAKEAELRARREEENDHDADSNA